MHKYTINALETILDCMYSGRIQTVLSGVGDQDRISAASGPGVQSNREMKLSKSEYRMSK